MDFVLIVAAILLSYANGANDNFKGVATLYGGKILSYRKSLALASTATLAGSLCSFFLATKLLKLFSGRGIVDQAIVQEPVFLTIIAVAAAITVLIATFRRFPISSTHSLVGAMLGTGLMSGGLQSLAAVGKAFFFPLFLGPLAALAIASVLYRVLHAYRIQTGIRSSFCFCIGGKQEVLIGTPGLLTIRSSGVHISIDEEKNCRLVYSGYFFGLSFQKIMDRCHMISAAAISFARGLNDTPKIAGLLLISSFLHPGMALMILAFVMLCGGILHSDRIARRMSFELTEMNSGQAFTANFVTAVLVISGSVFGLPLSTTHVSCGSLFGIGMANQTAKGTAIVHVLLAWLLTLPTAAILGALLWAIVR